MMMMIIHRSIPRFAAITGNILVVEDGAIFTNFVEFVQLRSDGAVEYFRLLGRNFYVGRRSHVRWMISQSLWGHRMRQFIWQHVVPVLVSNQLRMLVVHFVHNQKRGTCLFQVTLAVYSFFAVTLMGRQLIGAQTELHIPISAFLQVLIDRLI